PCDWRRRTYSLKPASGPMARGRSSSYLPLVAIGAGGPPGVADREKRRAIGLFESVMVGSGAQEAVPQGILPHLLFAPGDRGEGAALAGEPGIVDAGAAAPGPGAGRGGHHPDAEGLTAVPKPVDALREVWASQVDPEDD